MKNMGRYHISVFESFQMKLYLIDPDEFICFLIKELVTR